MTHTTAEFLSLFPGVVEHYDDGLCLRFGSYVASRPSQSNSSNNTRNDSSNAQGRAGIVGHITSDTSNPERDHG